MGDGATLHPDPAKRRSAVSNERTKLLANALDRASTACIAVGILGPTAAALYGVGSPVLADHGILFGISAFSWLIAATVPHMMARQVLGKNPMTGLWIFANVVLPLVLVAMGYAAMRLDQHQSSD